MRSNGIRFLAVLAGFAAWACSSDPQKNGLELACIQSGGTFQDHACQCGNTRCSIGTVCIDNGAMCAPDSWSVTELARLQCQNSGGIFQDNACQCGSSRCSSGIACIENGTKCASDSWSVTELARLQCQNSGGTFQDNACQCGSSRCSSGIACIENGTKCATESWSVSELFRLQCQNSGGVLDPVNADVCRCNNLPCEKFSVCERADGGIRCMMDAGCHVGETRCLNDSNGIGIKYTCSELSVWTSDGACENGNSCQDKVCGACRNGTSECCAAENDVQDCLQDASKKIKTCSDGSWSVSYCPGQFACKSDTNSCPYTDACDDSMGATCQNNEEGVGIIRYCKSGGRTEAEHCVVNGKDVSCRNAGECGECLSSDTEKKRNEVLSVDADGNESITTLEILSCEGGVYKHAACNMRCDTDNPDWAYFVACENSEGGDIPNEFLIRDECRFGCDSKEPSRGCNCQSGNYKYWTDEAGNKQYSVCIGKRWKKSDESLYLECHEDDEYLYLNLVPNTKGIGEIRLLKREDAVSACAYKNSNSYCSSVEIPEISCDLFNTSTIHELSFKVSDADQVPMFCVDSIVNRAASTTETGEKKPFFVHYDNNKIKFSYRIYGSSPYPFATSNLLMVSCNSNHSGVHRKSLSEEFAAIPAYDMRIDDFFSENEDEKESKELLVFARAKDDGQYEEKAYGTICYVKSLGEIVLSVKCSFYPYGHDFSCLGPNSEEEAICYIENDSVCIDFYSTYKEKYSYQFTINNPSNSDLALQKDIEGVHCPNGCNDTWTGCAD